MSRTGFTSWIGAGAAAVVLVSAITVASCTSIGSVSPEAQARWSRDSAAYVRDSIKWARDTFVRDSISRTVDTDTLYRLLHTMLVAQNPVPLFAEYECASGSLNW